MASSIATSKAANFHARSISLPSASHPINADVEDHLNRLLKVSCSSSSSSICHNLSLLKELHERLNDSLQLPLTQQALSLDRDNKYVEEFSLGLLDACGSVKDVVLLMNQELESSLRRRLCHKNQIHGFIISIKKVNKMIGKCLKNMESNNSKLYKGHQEGALLVDRLRDIEVISFSVFKSILSFLNWTKASSKEKNGWSLISKLMIRKKEQEQLDNVENIFMSLNALNRQKNLDAAQVLNVQKKLLTFESSIWEFEDGLEGLFRCLIKTRVVLLNVLNH